MPIIHRAIKKLHHDRKRAVVNARKRKNLHQVVKITRLKKTKKQLEVAFSTIDKAAKIKLIHPNKAARLKSRLSKLLKS
jgi:small subunit ribosomal protein S20